MRRSSQSVYLFERFILTSVAVLLGVWAIRLTPKTVVEKPDPEPIPVEVYFPAEGAQDPPRVYFLNARKVSQRDSFHPESVRHLGTIVYFKPE